MSDPRWPDDGPTWPERDLPDEDVPNPWADVPGGSGFDADAEPAFTETAFEEDAEPPFPEPPFPEPTFLGPPPEAHQAPPEPAFPEPPFPEPAFLERPAPEPEPASHEPALPQPEPEPALPQPEPALPQPEPMFTVSEPTVPEPEPASAPAATEPWSPAPEPLPPAPEPEPAWAAPEPTPPGPSLEAREPSTAFAEPPADAGSANVPGSPGWDPKLQGERRRPTTAEQAVPWLIGVILALAGIVIVLLALIFTAPNGLAGLSASPTPAQSRSGFLPTTSDEPTPRASGTPNEASATPDPTPAATATPLPEYGPLEMVYLGRPSALAPIYLLRRDFSEADDAAVVAQADIGVSAYAWSPDGRVGAAIIGERLVALTPGRSARALVDGVSAVAFGLDSRTVYALRIVRSGTDDIARVLEIDYRSGDAAVLSSIRYRHPVIGPDAPLKEAQFIDDGGIHRLYALADGTLAVWILGAPATYRVDTGSGSAEEIDRQPMLWSPDGDQRIDLRENDGGTTDIVLRGSDGDTLASVRVTGLVSHVRWVRTSNEIVFTLGRLGTTGGVRQDLYVWDLVGGNDPLPLTSNGVSFGAEWLGAAQHWLPASR